METHLNTEHSGAEEDVEETNEASTKLERDEVSTRCQPSVLVIDEDMAAENTDTKEVESEDTNNESRDSTIHEGINQNEENGEQNEMEVQEELSENEEGHKQ